MTLDEKRGEVLARRVRSITYDAEHCTSWEEEVSALLFRGVPGIESWSEADLDAYLAERDEEGNAREDDDEP